MDAMDPYSMYMMTEQFVSLSPGDVSDSVRERMIAMWNSVGGLNHREGDLLAKGVPKVKITMIRNFFWPSKKGPGQLNKSALATSSVSTPKPDTEKTPLDFDPSSMLSSTYANANSEANSEDENSNHARNPSTVAPESQSILTEIMKNIGADIYNKNDQSEVNKQVENLTQNMMKLVETILEEKNEMKLKIDSMHQEINNLKSEKESYASKAGNLKEIMKQQRLGDRDEQREIKRKKRDENVSRQLIIFGLTENVIKKADASNAKEYADNEKNLAFCEVQNVITKAREQYTNRKENNPDDFQDDELVGPPDSGNLVIDDIEFTSRIRPSNKRRVGMSNDSPTFKWFNEAVKKYEDYETKRYCKLTATFKEPEWCKYVKECQEYLVLLGNKKYNVSRNPGDLVRRTIQPYLTEKAKQNSRLMFKEARDDEIRRWRIKNAKFNELKEKKMSREAFDKWLDEDKKDSPLFIEKIMYAKDGWPDLKIVKYIEGRSSRYVDPKLFDDELKESS